jgi:hypothetical protein
MTNDLGSKVVTRAWLSEVPLPTKMRHEDPGRTSKNIFHFSICIFLAIDTLGPLGARGDGPPWGNLLRSQAQEKLSRCCAQHGPTTLDPPLSIPLYAGLLFRVAMHDPRGRTDNKIDTTADANRKQAPPTFRRLWKHMHTCCRTFVWHLQIRFGKCTGDIYEMLTTCSNMFHKTRCDEVYGQYCLDLGWAYSVHAWTMSWHCS